MLNDYEYYVLNIVVKNKSCLKLFFFLLFIIFKFDL